MNNNEILPAFANDISGIRFLEISLANTDNVMCLLNYQSLFYSQLKNEQDLLLCYNK